MGALSGGRTPRRSARAGALVTAAAAILALGASPALALGASPGPASGIAFGTPSASAVYGQAVRFEQPVEVGSALDRAEILLTTPGSLGPDVTELPAPACCGARTLRYVILETDLHIVPNTPLTARWRLRDRTGATWLGPEVGVTYSDTTFAWRTAKGPIVHVHWVQGDAAFGARALKIGEDAVARASALLGVTETEPIDFFVYPDEASLRAALGPGTGENVGGQAVADIRTLFAWVPPSEAAGGTLAVDVPHELTHLVFETAVRNPYHSPPLWLNEGLAVYLSEGYTPDWRARVEAAVADRRLIPLDGIAGRFPPSKDQSVNDPWYLSYGESVSAVDYLVRTDGQGALARLIRSYATGVSDDEAFRTALGQDVATFASAWMADLGAAVPASYGPRVGPPGPLPAGWESVPGASPSGSGPGASAAPAGGPASSGGLSGDDLATLGVLGLLIAGGAVYLVVRGRRRRRVEPPG